MNTIDDFFDHVKEIVSSRKFRSSSSQVYRGHSKDSFELLPTLYRAKTDIDVWELENNLYSDFKALVGPRIKFDSSWEALFAMRHEGIPTRLLDWTENIGTALFFALDSSEVESPHIWVLNPYQLNEKTSEIGHTLYDPEEDMAPYHESYPEFCNTSSIKIFDLPIAIYPRRSNDRIFAQRGLFTIHGKNPDKMEITCADCVEKIYIPVEIIPKLKTLLFQFGINKYSVYPDFKGLSNYLKEIYKY